MKYLIIYDNDNNIVSQPAEYIEGTAVATLNNFLVATKEKILEIFSDAIFIAQQ